MTHDEALQELEKLQGWSLRDGTVIEKEYPTRNFVETMALANRIAAIAEEQDHHPDLHLYYRNVHVVLSTHALKGLTENDFIVAAKIDEPAADGQQT